MRHEGIIYLNHSHLNLDKQRDPFSTHTVVSDIFIEVNPRQSLIPARLIHPKEVRRKLKPGVK